MAAPLGVSPCLGHDTVVELDGFFVGADCEVAHVVNAYFLNYGVVFLFFVENVYFFGAFWGFYYAADCVFFLGVFTFDCEVVPGGDEFTFLL